MFGIFADLFGLVVTFELPILRTTWDLLRAPGRTAAAWIGGQRKRYTNPVKYCVILGVIFLMLIRNDFIDPPRHVSGENGESVHQLSEFTLEYLAFILMIIALPFAPIAGALSRVFGVNRSSLDWYALFLYCLGISVLLQAFTGSLPESIAEYLSLAPVAFLLWGSWQFDTRRVRSLCVAVLGLVVTIAIGVGIQQLALAILSTQNG